MLHTVTAWAMREYLKPSVSSARTTEEFVTGMIGIVANAAAFSSGVFCIRRMKNANDAGVECLIIRYIIIWRALLLTFQVDSSAGCSAEYAQRLRVRFVGDRHARTRHMRSQADKVSRAIPSLIIMHISGRTCTCEMLIRLFTLRLAQSPPSATVQHHVCWGLTCTFARFACMN